MSKILVVESSPRGDLSQSRQLTQAIVETLRERGTAVQVQRRDLSRDPAPHLQASHLAAFFTPPEKRTDLDREAARFSEEAVAELLEADTIVIGVPMINFSIPSVLKAWIDQIARAGLTFQYGANGPEGLVRGKKVYLAIASGGIYSDGPMKSMDFTEPYLRAALGFLGMTDVTTLRVEGTAVPAVKEKALARALESLGEVSAA